MKKKLLIALFVAVLACVFAFTVSAANEVTLTDGTSVDIEAVFKVSGNTISGFNDGYSKDNIKNVVFPASITTVKNLNFNNSTVIESVTFEASESLVLDSVSFNSSSIKKATFNPECVLNYKSGNFYSCKSLTEITFPKFLALPGNCFQFNENMVPTNEIVFVEGVTTINCHMFNGCKKVWGEVVIPSTVTTIKEGTFNGTAITAFDFSKCVNLTSIGGGYGGSFANIDTVTSYDFSACVKLTKFDGPAMFEGSENLVSVILPEGLEKIPHKTFAHCYKLPSIVIPSSVTFIADESFHSARRGQELMTFTMFIQSDVELNAKYVFRDSGAKVEFVMIGEATAAQFTATNAGVDIVQSGSHSPLDNIEVIDYRGGEAPYSFVPGQARTSHVIVDNYCDTHALTGEHLAGENLCVILCSDCGLSTVKENPVHNKYFTIKYDGGYDCVGAKVTACYSAGCPFEERTEAKAIFDCLGYSAPEYNGNLGIAIGYIVNKAALTEYEEITGKSISYGVFVVLKDKLGDGEVLDENGEFTNGALGTEIRNKAFDAFEIKVTGLNESQKDVLIAIGAYVVAEKDEVAEYSYMQGETPNAGETYAFVSYNSIIEKLS